MRPRRPVPGRLRAGRPTVVADAAARASVGLDHWVDGTMGFVRDAAGTLVVAPNGPRIARHQGCADDLIADLVEADQSLAAPRTRLDHASGGPVLVDDATGELVLVYHGERFAHGDPSDYWSFLGLAVSADRGRTFVDLGAVVTSVWDEAAPDRPRPVELGPGACAELEGWVLVYFTDRAIRSTTTALGVARARRKDFFAATRARRAPVLHKVGATGDEPGLGGAAVDLLADAGIRPIWFDVARAGRDGPLLLVCTTAVLDGGRPLWSVSTAWSHDGLEWTTPRPLEGTATREEAIYVSIDPGRRPRQLDGRTFQLYRTVADGPDRWATARVERRRVRWTGWGRRSGRW